MKKHRSSAATLFDACPAAAYQDNDLVLLNPNDTAGNLGTAIHEAVADMVLGKLAEPDHYAMAHGLSDADLTDIRICLARARKFLEIYGAEWRELTTEFPMAYEDEGIEWSGHIDLGVLVDGRFIVVDWKSTRLEGTAYGPQMRNYLWLASRKFPEAKEFQAIQVFLRNETLDVSPVYTCAELDHLHAEYVNRLTGWDGKTYCPGGQCGYCPRMGGCDAHSEMIHKTLAAIEPMEAAIADIKPATCVDLYQRIRDAEKLCARGIEAIKTRLAAEGGHLTGAGGLDLVTREQKRETIKPKAGWAVMQKWLSDDELAACMTVRKTSILKAVADKADRGQKKIAKDDFMDQLRAVDAVESITVNVTALKKSEAAIETKKLKGVNHDKTEIETDAACSGHRQRGQARIANDAQWPYAAEYRGSV